jgi:hypothetical protein
LDQLIGVADHVGFHLAQSNALVGQIAASVPFIKEVRTIGFVDEHLERDTEFFAVVQNRGVRVRNSPRTNVDVQSIVKRAELTLSVDFGVCRALADAESEER